MTLLGSFSTLAGEVEPARRGIGHGFVPDGLRGVDVFQTELRGVFGQHAKKPEDVLGIELAACEGARVGDAP